MRKKLQEAIMSTPDFPTGFTELEYLEGSGTQWINTRLYLHGNSRVEFEAMPLQRQYTNFFFDASNTGSSTGKFGISFGYNGGHSHATYYRYGNQSRYIFTFADKSKNVLTLREKYHFVMHDGVLYKDGAAATGGDGGVMPIPAQEFTSAVPCYLFCSYGNSYAIFCSIMRMYSFSVKENDEPLLNLIPALRDSDGVVGMWDSVRNQFLTNSGQGTFGYKIKATGEVVAPKSA